MKKTKLNLLVKTWALALVFLSVGLTANAKVWVAADSLQLAALLPTAGNPDVLSGDTIELPDGAIINAYNVTGNTFLYLKDKFITIKAAKGALVRPKLIARATVNYIIQIPATSYAGLVLENIEIDGNKTARNGVFLANATIYMPKLVVTNCYIHHFSQSGVEASGSNNMVDSCLVDKSIFQYIGGTGYFAVRFNSNAGCRNFVAKNSTFSKMGEGVIRMGGYALAKKTVLIDHCTIDSMYNSANAVFHFGTALGGSSFIFTNNVLNRIWSKSNFWNRGAGFTNIALTNVKYSRVMNIGTYNFLSSMTSFTPDMVAVTTEPLFSDTIKSNYTLLNSTFLSAGNDGKTVGDPRWGASLGSFSLVAPAVNAQIDAFNKIIKLIIPSGTDLTKLVASFQLSAGASANIDGIAQVSGKTVINLSSPLTYNVVGQDGTVQNWKVIVNQKDFLTFAFAANSPVSTGPVDPIAKTIKLLVPYNTTITALKAAFTHTGDSVVVGTTTQVSGTTANDFTNPVVYKLYKNGEFTSWTVSVTTDGGITAMNFASPATTGIIDKAKRTVTLKVPFGTNLTTAIAATFTTSGDSVMVGSIKQVSGTTTNVFSSMVVYKVYKTGVAQDWTVTAVYDAAVRSFSLRSQLSSVINKNNKTISVVMPAGSSLTSVVANFNKHANVVVKVNTTVQDSGITANNYTSPVSFTFTPTTGTPETWTVSVSIGGEVLSAFSLAGQWYTNFDYTNKVIECVYDMTVSLTAAKAATFTIPSNYQDTVGIVRQVSGTTTQLYTTPVTHKISDGYNIQNWTVKATSFGFRFFYFASLGTMGVADAAAKTIAVTVPFSTRIDSLIPTWEIPGSSATCKIGTVVQTSATTFNNYTNPVVYTVANSAGTITQNITVTVTKAPALTIASLGFLTPFKGVLSPAFSPTIYDYKVLLPKGVYSAAPVVVRPTAGSFAKYAIDTAKVLPDTTEITVTAEDGVTKKVYNVLYSITPWDVNVSTLNAGTVSAAIASNKTVQTGGSSTLTATAGIGYEFVQWQSLSGTLISTANPFTLANIVSDSSIVALYKDAGKLAITASTVGGGTANATPSSIFPHESATFIAVPDIAHNFVKWTLSDGSDFTGNTNDTVTVLDVTAATNLVAVFAYKQYTVVAAAGSNGSVTGSLQQIINYGFDAERLVAVPSAHYHFVDWTENTTVVGTNDSIVLAGITSNRSVVANFDIDTFKFTAIAGANGTITGTLAQIIDYGTTADTIIAVPATGYHFVNWTKTDTSIEVSKKDTLILANVVSDTAVKANFAINVYTVEAIAGVNGTITGTLTQSIDHGSNATTLTAVPATGCHFVNWTKTGTTTEVGISTTLNLTSIIANVSVTANFAKNTYTVTAEVAVASTGTITGIPTAKVEYGTSVILTAASASGYNFVNWTKGSTVLGTDKALTIVVDKDTAVTANFAIKTYLITVSAAPDKSGTVVGAPTAAVDSGANVTLTANAADTYEFVNWTEDGTEVSASFIYTFTATKARTLVANFKLSVGINNMAQASVKVYPTIVYDYINIESKSLIKTVMVFDLTGKIVMVERLKSSSIMLNTSSLRNGVYSLIIETDNGFTTSKFEVIK